LSKKEQVLECAHNQHVLIVQVIKLTAIIAYHLQ
jgi:hypothetical protein